MKKSNKKYVIVLLVVLLLGLAVGYAAISDSLNITGSANAKAGTLDMEFSSSCGFVKTLGMDTANSSVTVSDDRDTLKVTIKDLHYPGAGAQVHVVTQNVGTLPAKITKVKPTYNGSSEQPEGFVIKGLDTLTTNHGTINPGDTCEFDFTVEWDRNWTDQNNEPQDITFDLGLEYEQDTQSVFNGTAGNHEDRR